jgi:hypothetical protein
MLTDVLLSYLLQRFTQRLALMRSRYSRGSWFWLRNGVVGPIPTSKNRLDLRFLRRGAWYQCFS